MGMYKVTFAAHGTNHLAALDRLSKVGLEPESCHEVSGVIKVVVKELDPIRSLLEDLSIENWSATPIKD